MKHAAIKVLEAGAAKRREAAICAVRAVQATCHHSKVVTDGNAYGGRRICAECGVEEYLKSGSSWQTADGGFYEFMRPAGLKPILSVEFAKKDSVVGYRVSLG